MTRNDPQQMILEATIACIEKYGIENTTTRKIALEAGTNIASINYYFRSKDELIARALGATIEHMMEDLLAIVQDEAQPFRAILRTWMVYLLEGVQRYPNVFMAHMYAPVVEKRFDTPGVQAIRMMLNRLSERAAQEYPQIDERELRLAVIDVVSVVFFKILAPGFFTETEHLTASELAERYTILFERMISAT